MHRIAMLTTLLMAGHLAAADVVIVNPKNPLAELDQATLQDIYLGRKTNWSNGDRIHLVVQSKGDLHEAFVKKHLDRTPSQFDVYWKKQIFTGKGSPPAEIDDDAAMVARVAKDEDAIGYISDSAPHDGVKAVPVR